MSFLNLPERESKPRSRGLTVMIDHGLPLGAFRDLLESHSQWVDYVKFGWGTAIVTRPIAEKIAACREHGVPFFFGGTLFEKAVLQSRVREFASWCRSLKCEHVEISNGTISLSNSDKADLIRSLSGEFTVFSEVGYKDTQRSLDLSPHHWVEYMQEDLAAGARFVITEARESGTSGICTGDGELRCGLISEILDSDIPTERIIFEVPRKSLQAYFISKIGPHVNLANIASHDLVALETLRLGLRSDTLMVTEQNQPGTNHAQ